MAECKAMISDTSAIFVEERPAGKLKLPKGIVPMLSAHKEYLRGRGFDPDAVAKTWAVRGIGLASRLAWQTPLVRDLAATQPYKLH
jgi:hypothetical protein